MCRYVYIFARVYAEVKLYAHVNINARRNRSKICIYFPSVHFLLQIGENMTELIDWVTVVFSRLGFPSDHNTEVQEFLKGVIKIFFAVIKDTLAQQSTLQSWSY